MQGPSPIETFIADWAITGGSELANTQSFVNGLCALLGVPAPNGSQTDDTQNDYVFERRVFQDNGDGTTSFGRLDAYKRGCFVLEAKQGSDAEKRGEDDFFGAPVAVKRKHGTARRGTPGWAAAMLSAKGQAERYAKALPLDHGWPPFLLVTDVGHCIDVYADFSGTGKAYTQFPDAARFRIRMEDLHDEAVRERLANIWTNPLSLDPSKEAARVTRDIATQLAELSKRLEKREQNPTRVADFLMRCLFTMFAEDVNLIPEGSFTALLEKLKTRPENFVPQITALWAAMDTGGFVGALGDAGETVRRFNGYLFKDTSVIALQPDEIALLIAAASHKWNHVEPAIFGTLLERALDGKERAKLGAHYTPRAYVDRLVMPTVIEPLRADWAGVQAAAANRIEDGKVDEARAMVEGFHAKLAATKVLDPACGTGNFLYVALARMKELEGEVIGLLSALGADQYVAEMTGHTITPENFLGIEINPRAASIAQLVLWIGYLQWHFRVNGEGRMPPEPVLRDVKTIENRDALIDWDKRELVRDDTGKPMTRWDGETMKLHPVTGKKVPDEAAQVEVYRYIKPRATKWPKADFIVGNPPFIGGKDVRERLGDGYFEALFKTSDVPESADFVMHWWDKAALAVRKGATRRFGFVTTNSIVQTFSRRVVAKHLEAKDRVSLVFAIPDHPWVDEKDGAAVRIAVSVGTKGKAEGRLLSVTDESVAPERVAFLEGVGAIGSNLRIGANVTSALILKSNNGLGHQGVKLHGDGFILTSEEAELLGRGKTSFATSVIKRFKNGKDITGNDRELWVIDVDSLTEDEVLTNSPSIYQHLMTHVKPVRDQNREPSRKALWWKFGRRNTELRSAIKGLTRFLVTVRTVKHRTFTFLDASVLPESRLVVVASEDAYVLGILSSRIHNCWALGTGAMLEDRPNYNNSEAFDPFPFPADVPEPLKDKIRAEAEALDALRKRVLAEHDDLTLTKLYNVLEALRANEGQSRALTDVERVIHDKGLVTLIRQHHDVIDALVAQAYGWDDWNQNPPRNGEVAGPKGLTEGAHVSADTVLEDSGDPSTASRSPSPCRGGLSDEEILTRLVALNKARAAEEAKGVIRWLRPEYQAPDYAAPINATLDLGEVAVPVPDNIIPWPEKLPDQFSAVAAILSGSAIPLAPVDVARNFKGKRAATVAPVLESLASVGMARRLADGRYAA